MQCIQTLALALLAATVSASPAVDIPACPLPGTTTSTQVLSGPTATVYKSAVGDGIFVNCHGYTNVHVATQYKPKATTTRTITGGTTAVYLCSPTSCPKPCTAGTLTSTTTAPGGKTSTQYAFTELALSSINCSGYSAVNVKTKLKVAPTTTVQNAGSTGITTYTCSATPICG